MRTSNEDMARSMLWKDALDMHVHFQLAVVALSQLGMTIEMSCFLRGHLQRSIHLRRRCNGMAHGLHLHICDQQFALHMQA